MKSIITLLFIFLTISSFAQITFPENIVIDDTNVIHRTRGIHNGDIDGDGDIDIAIADRKLISGMFVSKIQWFENNDGQGNFDEPHIISTSTIISSMILEDIDGDNDLDIVVSTGGSVGIKWFENLDGQGSFSDVQDLFDISFGQVVHAIDIENDGDLDLLVGKLDGGFRILTNNGNMNFSGSNHSGSGPEVSSIISGDIDGDGFKDIFLNNLVWIKNLNGTGAFGGGQTIESNFDIDIDDTTSMFRELYDFDNDGDLDILASAEAVVVWFENTDGLGNFGPEIVIANAAYARGAVDVDNDGDLDVIANSSTYQGLSWFENTNGIGDFNNERAITKYISGNACTVADFDGDGKMDMTAFNNDSLNWFGYNESTNNFEAKNFINKYHGGAVISCESDIDGDGDLDIVAYSFYDQRLAWFENIDGSGTFGSQKFIQLVSSANQLFVEDMDNDGDKDIILSSFYGGKNIVKLENLNGAGNFSNAEIVLTFPDGLVSAAIEDVNGDNVLDIIAIEVLNESELFLFCYWNNLTSDTFQGSYFTQVNPGITKAKISTEDINLDGKNDIIVNTDGFGSQYTPRNFWIEATTDTGGFGTKHYIPEVEHGAAFVDIDNDTDLDMIAVWNSNLRVFQNDGIGSGDFSLGAVILDTGPGSPSSINIKSFDIDEDGDKDVIYGSSSSVRWFKNLDGIGGAFGEPQYISNISAFQTSLNLGDFNQDNHTDLLFRSNEGKIAWFGHSGVDFNTLTGSVNLTEAGMSCDISNPSIPNAMVVADNGTNTFATFTDENGNYELYPGEGTFNTSITGGLPSYYDPIPASQTTVFTGFQNSGTADFCIEPNQVVNDVNITIYPISEARPGFEAQYQLEFNNMGTTILSGEISISFDDSIMSFLDASETVASQTANALTFDYSDLSPYQNRTIDLNFQIFTPPTTNIDDVLFFNAEISPIADDFTEDDNTFTLEQIVIGSFDPNDMTVLEGEEIDNDDIDEYLHYIIRFQNTGTASAINVKVTNELDPNLDWSTLKLGNMSHSNVVNITNGNQIEFIFNNINLPDENSNEPESHGYIQYKIKPLSTLEIGDSMMNTAEIFFDFNPPIITNTVTTTVADLFDANQPVDLLLCSENTIETFDLTQTISEILGAEDPSLFTLTYHETLISAQNGTNAVTNSVTYQNLENPQTIFARLESNDTGVFDTTDFVLLINPLVSAIPPTPFEVCDDDNDGLSSFNLNEKDAEIIGAEQNIVISYHETFEDAEANEAPLSIPYQNTTSNSQTIFARATRDLQDNPCFAIVPLDLVVNNIPNVTAVTDLVLPDIDGDGFEIFDLTTKSAEILNGQNDIGLSFYETESDAQNNINLIATPESYTNVTNPQTVYTRLENQANFCSSVSEFVLFADINLGTQTDLLKGLKIYPNPVKEVLFIDAEAIIISSKIYNQLGQLVFSLENKDGISSIDIKNIEEGIYFIEITSSNNTTDIKKFIKE